MATFKILLGIFCLGTVGGHSMLNRTAVAPGADAEARAKVLHIARQELGVRECGGNNSGNRIASYLRYAGLKKPAPWCAAYVSWVFGQAGFKQPRTPWSPALFPKERQIIHPLPASVFGIYFPELKRIGHCGLVERQAGIWLITLEGNTNIAGSREGDGVYRKRRLLKRVSCLADWLAQKGGKHEK